MMIITTKVKPTDKCHFLVLFLHSHVVYFLQDNFHNFTGFASGVFRYSPENPDLLTTLGLLYMQVS